MSDQSEVVSATDTLGNPVYVLLAADGPERFESLGKTVRSEVLPDEEVTVLVATGEEAVAQAAWTGERAIRTVAGWSIDARGNLRGPALPDDPRQIVIFLSHGSASPVDFLEALQRWLVENGGRVGRITTLVNCTRCAADAAVRHWYDACIHFSDLVWLGNREGVEPKWVKDFEEGFRKRAFPCLFDGLKKGQPANPNWFFECEDRRISLLFDEIEDDPEDDEMPENPVDPYLDRNLGGGRRREVRDI